MSSSGRFKSAAYGGEAVNNLRFNLPSRGAIRQSARRKSLGPSTGFEIFVLGRQDLPHEGRSLRALIPHSGSADLIRPSVAHFLSSPSGRPVLWTFRPQCMAILPVPRSPHEAQAGDFHTLSSPIKSLLLSKRPGSFLLPSPSANELDRSDAIKK